MTKFDHLFVKKNRSYKMLLILSFLNVLQDKNATVALESVAEEFRRLLVEREKVGTVDNPPASFGETWRNTTIPQIKQILSTPINALLEVLVLQGNQLGFRKQFLSSLKVSDFMELRASAESALNVYWAELNEHPQGPTLRDSILHVMNTYLEAKRTSFPTHTVSKSVTREIPAQLRQIVSDDYMVKGSVGQGNWATIPWIAIMDTRITKTTREGVYVVYLFSDDMESCYLTLNQGVTKVIEEQGRVKGYSLLRSQAEKIRDFIKITNMEINEDIRLSENGLGRDYQASTIAYVKYERDKFPDNQQLLDDLKNAIELYETYAEFKGMLVSDNEKELTTEQSPKNLKTLLDSVEQSIRSNGFYYGHDLIRNLYISLKVRPFVILAGISGTGKSRLVSQFARVLGATSENGRFKLISVRPDWSDPSELVGYKNLQGDFIPGPLTDIIRTAHKSPQVPHFVLLDEMNLARVEYYLSDVLSVMETQRRDSGRLVTDPLIQIGGLSKSDTIEYSTLGWPENLYLIGTVNMDETTYSMSKKVLDRATTIEFNDIDLGLGLTNGPEESLSIMSSDDVTMLGKLLKTEYININDVREFATSVQKILDVLTSINDILAPIGAHVGYRTRDVIAFFLIYCQRFSLFTDEEVIDLQIYQKILPRIQGSNVTVRKILIQLLELCAGQTLGNKGSAGDPEAYTPWLFGEDANYPKSARKIASMLKRMDDDGFTSFWG